MNRPVRRKPALLRSLLFCSLLSLTLSLASVAQQPDYQNQQLSPEVRAHDLVSKMTLDEKASQLEDWAIAIPRLGIPDYQTWNEALHGVARAGYATVFPQAIGMAATWDPAIVHAMGDVISTEARAKYNRAQQEGNHRIFYGLTFWSPNINIFRDPRWGRGQETYGEDPFLTGKLGVAFISGVQGDDPAHPKAIATSKHFAVHSGPESTRHTADVHSSPRDLEETYLPAFRTTVIDGHVGSVMCAYNAIDTYAACANKMLLQDHLRNAWGFKGFVVSDCAAIMDVFNGHHNAPDITHAAAISVEAGTDLSCSIWAPGFNTLADAVRQKLVSEDLITRAAERLYTARFRLGLFDASPYDAIPFSANASSANRAQALKAAEEAIVLLKNDGTLPLKKAPANIAVVGPTADLIQSLEGNYNGVPVQPVEPVDGIAAQFAGSQIHYAQGSTLAEGAKVPVPRTAFNEGRGLTTEYFATPNWTGRPVAVSTDHNIQAEWGDSMPVPEIRTHVYSVRWSGKIAVPAAGHYTFSVEPADAFPYSPKDSYRLTLDGKVLGEGELRRAVDISAMGGNFKSAPGASPSAPPVFNGGTPAAVSVDFTDTNPHDFKLEYSHSGDQAGGGLYFKWAAPAQAQLDEAVAAAKQSDVVVAFVGLSPQLEGEEMPIKIDGFAGGDRTKIGLPAAQLNLLDAVAATGRPVVVVLMSGSAVAVPQDHAAAILEAWYPGVEGGTAIARTIAGLNNPAGRLPVTFYQSVDDLPAFDQYSMKNRTYRYYTGKPEWGFGFGLSYSTFKYGPVSLSSTKVQAGEPLTATVSVTNSSALAGDEVIEAYLKTPQTGGPIHSLAAFQRVHLHAGETRDVTLHFDPRQLSSVDEKGERSILPGKYELTLSAAQPEETKAKSETTFTVTGAQPLPR